MSPDLIAAVRKLVKAKGRYHTEQNYMALVAALDAHDVAAACADAPVAEDVALPPLPEPKYCADDLTDIFTAEQMSSYARQVVAPYAERIRLLERALRSANLLLAEAFISTGKAMSSRAKEVSDEIEQALAAAYIDGRTAGTAPDESKHIESEAVSAMLWLYRRLPRCYGRPPNVEQPISALAKLAGVEMNFVTESFAERGAATSNSPASEVKNG